MPTRSTYLGWWLLLGVLPSATTTAEMPAEMARWFAPQAWERDVDKPVISLGSSGQFDDMHIFAPAVAFQNSQEKFLLWYCGSRGNPGSRVFRLGLATSADGKHFEKSAENPVLQFADAAHSVLTPALLRSPDGTVVRENGKLRMWFSSATLGKGGLHTLHESSSEDGIHWAEPSSVLLENVYCPTVLRSDAGYQMWFSDVSRRPWLLRHAASSDGRSWKVTSQPVLQLSQSWEGEVLVYPTVIQVDGVYLMWYGSYDAAVHRETTAIGFAASPDGLKWTKHPNNPVLRPDPKRAWESNYVGSGCVVRLANGSFRYWYASRKQPPFLNLYFAINTARWSGPPALAETARNPKSEKTPDYLQKYLRRCDEEKLALVEAKAREINELEATKDATAAVHTRLKAARHELQRIREQPAPLAKLPIPTEKDAVGVFAPLDPRLGQAIEVLEVVDEDDVIIRAWYWTTMPLPANATAAEDATFVDLWVHGVDTSRMAVNSPAQLGQVFHVSGTKLFDTTCGKRSLPLLEAIDLAAYK